MLECNKNYVVLALKYMLKNSKKTISVLEIKRIDRKNNKYSTYKYFLLLTYF